MNSSIRIIPEREEHLKTSGIAMRLRAYSHAKLARRLQVTWELLLSHGALVRLVEHGRAVLGVVVELVGVAGEQGLTAAHEQPNAVCAPASATSSSLWVLWFLRGLPLSRITFFILLGPFLDEVELSPEDFPRGRHELLIDVHGVHPPDEQLIGASLGEDGGNHGALVVHRAVEQDRSVNRVAIRQIADLGFVFKASVSRLCRFMASRAFKTRTRLSRRTSPLCWPRKSTAPREFSAHQ